MAGRSRRLRSGRTHIQPLGKCSTEPTPTAAVPSPFQNHGDTGLVSCEAEEQGMRVGALAQPAASWWLEQAAGLLWASVYTFIEGGFGLGYLQVPSTSTTLCIHNPQIRMVNNSTVGWQSSKLSDSMTNWSRIARCVLFSITIDPVHWGAKEISSSIYRVLHHKMFLLLEGQR